jgi:hypothetical protein
MSNLREFGEERANQERLREYLADYERQVAEARIP